jgi:hypothetical protein
MATFTSKINGKDIYAKRAEATRKGVNLETFTEDGVTTQGILPAGIATPKSATDDDNILATKKYVQEQVGEVAEAMLYKGAVSQASDLPTADYKAGWTYKVAESGTYAGQVCEVGDLIIANKDYEEGKASNTDWDVIQTNIDGAVVGPASAVGNNIAAFDGTTGKLIKDGGIAIDNIKTKQAAVSVTGDTLKGVASFSQNANGEATLVLNDIQDGTTSQKGVVQLQGTVGASEAEDGKAATPKAVRDAINALDVELTGFSGNETVDEISQVDGKLVVSKQHIQIDENQVWNLEEDLEAIRGDITDLQDNKQDNLSFEGTYDASTNKVATESTVSDAIEALDVTAISVGADKTLTSISETDGKISATPVAIQIAESQVTNLTTDLAAKADKVTTATSGNFAGLDANGNLTDSGSKAADFATAAQGAKADSAIQGVMLNNVELTKDANNKVNIPYDTSAHQGSPSDPGLMTYETINLED